MSAALCITKRGVFGLRAKTTHRPCSVVVLALKQKVDVPRQQNQFAEALRPAAVTAIINSIMAMPAAAEAGKIFDFNMTMPIMATQFLLLMVFLEKTWFSPVGKVLDERDSLIREKLGSVKDNSTGLEQLATEAEDILRKARSEVTAMVSSKKNAKQAELDKSYAEMKDKVTKEVEIAISALETESGAMLKKLDAQVEKISDEVLKRVLPQGVKI